MMGEGQGEGERGFWGGREPTGNSPSKRGDQKSPLYLFRSGTARRAGPVPAGRWPALKLIRMEDRNLPELTIHVDLGPASYDAVVGHGNLAGLGARLRALSSGNSLFVVTDSRVGPLHAARLEAVLRQAGLSDIGVATVPEGEASKSVEGWTYLLGQVHGFSQGKKQKPLLLNLGGGMIGDLGGFVAAAYTRGCPYVQIPTSLMAMVDSSLGGKVGVDFATAKNILGSFYQPRLVFVDGSFLETLDRREIVSGLAEVVKYGVIRDAGLFRYLESNHEKLLALDPEAVFHVVARCLEIKARVVEKDPLDQQGVRIILNYGHTIGHAIEAASDYGYKHGESVAIGMAGANYLAVRLGLIGEGDAGRINRLLEVLGLPVRARGMDIERVMAFLGRDKKFTERTNRFVLPTGIGSVQTISGIEEPLIAEAVQHSLSLDGRGSG